MILTASAIKAAVERGDIIITPFDETQLSPNSYDFRLGTRVKTYTGDVLDAALPNEIAESALPADGMELHPGHLYLVNTYETMGSSLYVPIIRGRSSTGRLGLFIDVTADLIDLGSVAQWTLQLVPVLPVRVYPHMLIGQVTFWSTHGARTLYAGKYADRQSPVESLSYLDFRTR